MNSVLRIMTMIAEDEVSQCCKATLKIERSVEEVLAGAKWYTCSKCGEQCNTVPK